MSRRRRRNVRKRKVVGSSSIVLIKIERTFCYAVFSLSKYEPSEPGFSSLYTELNLLSN